LVSTKFSEAQASQWLYFSPDFPYNEQELDDQWPAVAIVYERGHFKAILDIDVDMNAEL
jgi:hypothetical protein